MAILFSDTSYRSDKIYDYLKKYMPDENILFYPDIKTLENIEFAIVNKPAHKSLLSIQDLKMIFTIGAGVDAVLQNPEDLPDVPICRYVSQQLITSMVEYAIFNVLKYHRNFHIYKNQQTQCEWRQLRQVKPQDRTIGVMGLGAIGQEIVKKLRGFNFSVCGWSRSEKNIPKVKSYYGDQQLKSFVQACDILINVLPLTKQTQGILNKDFFNHVKNDTYLIHCGRGAQLNENNFLEALKMGKISHASLDVFGEEPLPKNHLFWSHPKIDVTPHIASLSDFEDVANYIKKQIKNFKQGKIVENLVDRTLGY